MISLQKKSLALALLIGQIFIWTGSAFMTILYRLYGLYSAAQATLITEGLYYIMQAAGMLAFALFYRSKKASPEKMLSLAVTTAATALFTVAALCVQAGPAVIFTGCIMNLGIGVLSGQCFTRIALYVPWNERGTVFGIAYAIGSVGTYLLSLPNGGQGLTASYIIYIYIGMMVLSVILGYLSKTGAETAELHDKPTERNLIIYAFFIPFLCYLVYNLGNHYPAMGVTGSVNPAFTRAFYAVGLIAAGVINDRSRKTGAVACFLSLVFPFIALTLHRAADFATILSILSYLFLGFLSVFRIILFTDVATHSEKLHYMAPFGLMMGTLGSVAGTVAGIVLDRNEIALTLVTAGLFIVYGILFFSLYTRIYMPAPITGKTDREKLFDFQVKYGLNANQTKVLKLILDGCSNKQIASELYLAESTIKYHVSNLLKSTGCKNRDELTSLYHDF